MKVYYEVSVHNNAGHASIKGMNALALLASNSPPMIALLERAAGGSVQSHK